MEGGRATVLAVGRSGCEVEKTMRPQKIQMQAIPLQRNVPVAPATIIKTPRRPNGVGLEQPWISQ